MSYSPQPVSSVARPPTIRRRLSWLERLVLVGAGSVLLGLLIAATRLTPSPRGLGTHQQLGLPPCSVLQWFGVRCPSCGMTTSWSYVVRGQVVDALQASAGGALLALTAAVCGPWLVATGLWGRWLLPPPHEIATLALGLTIVAVTLIDWCLKLSLGW
jgi:hypothetical protein